MSKVITLDMVKKRFSKYGYEVLDDVYIGCKSKLNIKDDVGYKYFTYPDAVNEKQHRLAPFHSNNPYTIYNINIYLKNRFSNRFECISDIYENKRSSLSFKCNNCGTIFESNWDRINRIGETRNGLVCPRCGGRNESLYALILKQIFIHEYPDTIVEEKSCINPITNNVLPTDIVNHSMRIAIEIQSEWHDNDYSAIKDKHKKNYWLNKGYSFYAPDIRDYTILEMIKLFFPNLERIPSYVNLDYSNKLNLQEIQDMLNNHHSIPDISNKMDIKIYRIYDAIYDGRLYYPKDYIKADLTCIVQLDLDGNYLNKFDSIASAERKTGINKYNISAALNRGRNYSGGFYWVKYNDYINNDFNLKCRQTNIKKSLETTGCA